MHAFLKSGCTSDMSILLDLAALTWAAYRPTACLSTLAVTDAQLLCILVKRALGASCQKYALLSLSCTVKIFEAFRLKTNQSYYIHHPRGLPGLLVGRLLVHSPLVVVDREAESLCSLVDGTLGAVG